MSNPDRSIDPRLKKSAMEEFLSYGYNEASLSRICSGAGVTTGALYKRFNGKEDLFGSLVGGVIADLGSLTDQKAGLLEMDVPEALLVKCWDMNYDTMMSWFTFLEKRRQAFTLLMRCAEGTVYEKFEHEYSERMTELNYRFYLKAYERGIAREKISKKDMHIADSAYWKAICEPFIHDYSFEEIKVISRHICHFFDYYSLIGVDPALIEKYRDYNFYLDVSLFVASKETERGKNE